jgi:hypothetical protein
VFSFALFLSDMSPWFGPAVAATYVGVGLAMFCAVVGIGWLIARVFLARRSDSGAARSEFLGQRPELETIFFQAASASGKPRGLRWKACEWNDHVEYAREKQTGNFAALVGVTIQFEAIEGGDMEGVAAVGNLRNASAVFFYDRGQWRTIGKAVFNLNPDEALAHFAAQYERLPSA